MHCLRLKNWHPSAKITYTKFRNFRICHQTNGNDFPRCPQEHHETYIKYEAYYDKKTKASKLKEQQMMYVLQPKADHQGSEIPFTHFRWIGLYIVE